MLTTKLGDMLLAKKKVEAKPKDNPPPPKEATMLSMSPIKDRAGFDRVGFRSCSRIPEVGETVYFGSDEFEHDEYYEAKVILCHEDGEGGIGILVAFKDGATNSFRLIVKG